MKKGGGTGPAKPWQPADSCEKEKVPNPIHQPWLKEKISYK